MHSMPYGRRPAEKFDIRVSHCTRCLFYQIKGKKTADYMAGVRSSEVQRCSGNEAFGHIDGGGGIVGIAIGANFIGVRLRYRSATYHNIG